MTKELFEKALKIQEEIELNKKTLIPLEARVKRFDDYIEWIFYIYFYYISFIRKPYIYYNKII